MEYHSHAVVTEIKVTLLEQGQASELTDYVANEVRVALVYNGIAHCVMMCSASDLEDFAIGFSLSEGIIDSLAPATGARFALLPPENATGNFTKIVQRVPVKIRIPEPGALAGKLRPGLSSEVIVDTRTPDPMVAAN